MSGVLQVVPVEIGAQVSAGANLARVADPSRLKPEVRIAETQAKGYSDRTTGIDRYP
jgi:HlyD family secretion protein